MSGATSLQSATPDLISRTIRDINAQWCEQWTDSGRAFSSWAGECGLFFHYVWETLRDQGFEVQSDSFDDGLTCATSLVDPPGLPLQQLIDLGVTEHLNHVWIVACGLHFDAAHPDGVASPWELRVVRQALLEAMQLKHAELARELCANDPWWAESQQLLTDFLLLVGDTLPPDAPRP